MILEQLMFGMLVVAVVVLLLPFLPVMAGVAAATLFWFAAFAALLGAWIFWLVFPVPTVSPCCCWRCSSDCCSSTGDPGIALIGRCEQPTPGASHELL
jgi:hypothetical protein